MPPKEHPLVVLFGYDSSPFTNKVRLALRVKHIPFSIGREIYCDTSLIIEALEHFFPASQGWGSVYPKCEGMDDWTYRGLIRGFASFWTDTRAQLIGHKLDASKLESKIPQNLSNLDLHLAMLEPTFRSGTWAVPTKTPSLADISLYYQLKWGIDIAAGKGIYNLSGGGTQDTSKPITDSVFNKDRYPGLWNWFQGFEMYIASIPDLQITVRENDTEWKKRLQQTPLLSDEKMLVTAAVEQHPYLDVQRGLKPGVAVSVFPDDTGRDNPTLGKLVKTGVEEVVITPHEQAEMDVRIHFPRLGFVVKVVGRSQL